MWLEDRNDSKRSLTVRDGIPLIVFPGLEASNLRFEEDSADKLMVKEEQKLQFMIHIQYLNKLSEREHNTIRNYCVIYTFNQSNI